jgi:hypothetical protein
MSERKRQVWRTCGIAMGFVKSFKNLAGAMDDATSSFGAMLAQTSMNGASGGAERFTVSTVARRR